MIKTKERCHKKPHILTFWFTNDLYQQDTWKWRCYSIGWDIPLAYTKTLARCTSTYFSRFLIRYGFVFLAYAGIRRKLFRTKAVPLSLNHWSLWVKASLRDVNNVYYWNKWKRFSNEGEICWGIEHKMCQIAINFRLNGIQKLISSLCNQITARKLSVFILMFLSLSMAIWSFDRTRIVVTIQLLCSDFLKSGNNPNFKTGKILRLTRAGIHIIRFTLSQLPFDLKNYFLDYFWGNIFINIKAF